MKCWCSKVLDAFTKLDLVQIKLCNDRGGKNSFFTVYPTLLRSQPKAIVGDGEWGEDPPGGSPASGGAAQTVQSAETQGESE